MWKSRISSLENRIEPNCPFDEVCAAQAELSSFFTGFIIEVMGGLPLNMF